MTLPASSVDSPYIPLITLAVIQFFGAHELMTSIQAMREKMGGASRELRSVGWLSIIWRSLLGLVILLGPDGAPGAAPPLRRP